MNFFLKTLFGFSILILSFSTNAQEKRIVSCVLLDVKDSTPVAYAHILNHKANIGTSSNIKGEFNIPLRDNDSLMISKIGFQTIEIHEKDIVVKVYLKRKAYELDQFSVLPYKDFEEFKEAFAKLKIENNEPKINRSIFLSVDELKSYEPKGSGIVARGAISALAALFNKRIKDKKNYERLLREDKYESLLATRFNQKMVKSITKLKSNKSIMDFMDYCDFTNEFIERGSEYDIITQIYECYDEYNALPIASK